MRGQKNLEILEKKREKQKRKVERERLNDLGLPPSDSQNHTHTQNVSDTSDEETFSR